eukprot:TRINITY_DN2348_c0_g1_i1.p2 TRINITY_DN2348_c0_g1~~TRINITY_DN2348_c0_g1_i1.p2  ORF type:complete len:535 (+),score=79.46 TRINITY_DN2348_c0_g1_i1:3900-5504(+)
MCYSLSSLIIYAIIYKCIYQTMKGLNEIFKKAKEECKKLEIANLLLKYENIATFKLNDTLPEMKEKSRLVIAGTLQGISGNNLERKSTITKTLEAALAEFMGEISTTKVAIKVSPINLELPQMTVHDLKSFSATSSILPGIPTLAIFWKPFLDCYPSRELASDFLAQHKDYIGKLRIISIAIHCKYESAAQESMKDDSVEHYWMDSKEIKRIRETIPDISSGAYYYIIGDTAGKIVAAGNPQEVVLKDEVEKVIGKPMTETKKEMEEIKEEEEEEVEDTIEEEEQKTKVEEKKYSKTIQMSFLEAKEEVKAFIVKNLAEIQMARKYAKSFKINLIDEYRSKYNTEEFVHHGTSIQMVAPISEKYLAIVKPFIQAFEEHFSQLLTVYTSGPVYGTSSSFSFNATCSQCGTALGEVPQLLCLKCPHFSLCPKCYTTHPHLLHYIQQGSKEVGDEIVPKCKKAILRTAQRSCMGCHNKSQTKQKVKFVCRICDKMVLCQECFELGTFSKNEAIRKECEKLFPHHNFDTHLYALIPFY